MTSKLHEIQVSYTRPENDVSSITTSKHAFDFLDAYWNKNTMDFIEESKMLLLTRVNKPIGVYTVSTGGTTGTVIDPKVIFSVALKCNAHSIILAHNHPSGSLSPSAKDDEITTKLKKAGNLLDLPLLDHLVVNSDGEFYSYADEGRI